MKRALDACSSLERREAALVRSELAVAAACDVADRDEDRRMLAARSSVARPQKWTAASCAFFDLRNARSTIERASRVFECERARELAGTHDALRRHWATLVRGLMRRESRRRVPDEDAACLG